MKKLVKYLSILLFAGILAVGFYEPASAGYLSLPGVMLLTGLTLESLTHTDGETNVPGLMQKIVIGAIDDCDLSRWPLRVVTDPSGAGTFQNAGRITDNIYLLENKDVYEFYGTPENGEDKATSVGDVDGMSANNEITWFIPGKKAELLGFIHWAQNAKLFVIAPDMNGQAYLHGTEAYPARLVNYEVTSGKDGGSKRGAMLTFRYRDAAPAPLFEGGVKHSFSGSGYTIDEELFYTD